MATSARSLAWLALAACTVSAAASPHIAWCDGDLVCRADDDGRGQCDEAVGECTCSPGYGAPVSPTSGRAAKYCVATPYETTPIIQVVFQFELPTITCEELEGVDYAPEDVVAVQAEYFVGLGLMNATNPNPSDDVRVMPRGYVCRASPAGLMTSFVIDMSMTKLLDVVPEDLDARMSEHLERNATFKELLTNNVPEGAAAGGGAYVRVSIRRTVNYESGRVTSECALPRAALSVAYRVGNGGALCSAVECFKGYELRSDGVVQQCFLPSDRNSFLRDFSDQAIAGLSFATLAIVGMLWLAVRMLCCGGVGHVSKDRIDKQMEGDDALSMTGVEPISPSSPMRGDRNRMMSMSMSRL